MDKITISDNQLKVLKILVSIMEREDACIMFFKMIADKTGLEVRLVRLACRALKRKGLAQYVQAFDYDGMINGSGYMATSAGGRFIDNLEN